ncbi:MAG TPA: septal ring lytic transglycosylase RlpA family protein [Thermodesulfobacteriota bacterium]|nr:septal ring lytic transglycosylase RlpA family protein [Thermodesulfobacteriota bacterium]
MSRRTELSLLAALLFISACASPRRGVKEGYPPEHYPLEGYTQVGIASWYGIEEHGKYAASGERFSMHDHTAAHRSLPLGTVVRVTNLENGRDVIVRINDRGPFVDGRIIDLSYAAAKSIGMITSGTTKVKVKVISAPGRTSDYFEAKYTVQVGSFRDRENAFDVKSRLDGDLDDVRIETLNLSGETYYRVRVGRYSQRHDAEKVASKLRRYGYRGNVILE